MLTRTLTRRRVEASGSSGAEQAASRASIRKPLAAFAAALFAMATLVVVSASPASATNETCFGYTGNFVPPSTGYPTFQYVPDSFWPGANCFGISPDRRIWVTSASRPWAVIPGGGLADGLAGYRYDPPAGGHYAKTVQVYVKPSGNFYCQTWWSDTNWVGHWTLCNGGIVPN